MHKANTMIDPNPNGFRDTFFDLDYVYDPFDEPEEDFNQWIDFLYSERKTLGDTHPLTGEEYN